jgi:alpha-tubulin suppressor-like RCC1 family protein/serine/threonine protein kinase/HAMP domain-containing protein
MTLEQTTAHPALEAQYELLRELGRGGTAVVYLAKERATGAEVAIKLIRAKYIEDEEALARFAREARFISQLDHPNIVPVRAVLDLGTSGLAIVMAHLAGHTLREVLRNEGPLAPDRVERVLRDIGGALGAAHATGIVHRDVKPENIFIDADGRAVLADFGLARSMSADTQLTMTGVALGTPSYMAPEQIDGVELDARADVYSLGLVAWEMLTGRRPWDGHSLYAVLYSQKHELLPDVRAFRPDVPEHLAEVILRAIDKNRNARWQSMGELRAALDAAPPPREPMRYTPVGAETTRFVRPVTPFAPEPAQVLEETPRSTSIVQPWAQPPAVIPNRALTETIVPDAFVTVTPPRRRQAMVIRATAVAAGIVLVTVVAAYARSWLNKTTPVAEHITQPVQAGDVAKPVPIGPPLSAPVVTAPGATQPTRGDSARVAAPPAVAATGAAGAAALPDSAAARSSAPKFTLKLPTVSIGRVDATPPAPTAASGVGATASRIVAGGTHSCLVASDDHVFCWGSNDRGQLGSGAASRTPAPLVIGGEGRFSSVAAGLSHTCAITRGGAAWCWGDNDHGQLGDRSFSQRGAPVRVAEDHAFQSITAGASHTCGLDSNDIAWCWGTNAHGQLGTGDTSTRDSTVPIAVDRAATRFTSIVAGWSFTCGLGTNGRAWCWGANAAGQLGDGAMVDRATPTAVASDVAFTSLTAGNTHACGVTAQGEAYCWGKNANGQLGDGTTTDRTVPTRVRSNAHFVSITAGAVHTCGVTSNGEVLCWGRNTYGQLGTGTTTDASTPTSVGGGYVFSSVRAFGSHTCGVTTSNAAFCWGYNVDGQLGDGTRVDRTRPVRVASPGGG